MPSPIAPEALDGVSSGMNLDDGPPPDMFPTSRIASGTGQVGDSIVPEGNLPDESRGEIEPEVSEPQPGAKRKAGLQNRINTLVRVKYETQNENNQLRSQLAAVTQEMQQLRGVVSRLPTSRAQPPVNASGDIFAGGAGEADSAGRLAPDVGSIVEAAIQRAVAPLYESQRQIFGHAEQNARWAQVFEDVAGEFPDLRDPNSELRQAYIMLEQARPDLAAIEDKPRILAIMARGIVADQRREEKTMAAKKRAAAVHVPVPQGGGDTVEADVVQNKSVRSAVEQARERMRNGTSDRQDYKLLRLYGSRVRA